MYMVLPTGWAAIFRKSRMDTVSGTVVGGTVVGGTVVGGTVVGGTVVVGTGSVVGVVVVGFAGLTQPQSNSITIRMQKIRFISSFAFFVLSCRIISRRGEKSKEGLHLPDAGV